MTPSELKALLSQAGIYLSRQRGQNYLVDDQLLNKWVSKARLAPEEAVLEIGTGMGALTEALLKQGCRVISYEIDRKVFECASRRLSGHENLKLLHEDFLKADFLKEFQGNFRVFANIPYHITGPILIRLWEVSSRFQDAFLLLQKEVALRLAATSREGGFLSILLHTEFEVSLMGSVPPTVFFPVPKVDSMYLKLVARPKAWAEKEKKLYFDFVKFCFAERRKQLLPRLRSLYPERPVYGVAREMGFKETLRAEELDSSQFLDFFRRLFKGNTHE